VLATGPTLSSHHAITVSGILKIERWQTREASDHLV
jgi:hypothetical protein